MILGKLYANVLLANLNARESNRRDQSFEAHSSGTSRSMQLEGSAVRYIRHVTDPDEVEMSTTKRIMV